MISEIRKELEDHIVPFWEGLKDDTYGGYFGYLDYDLQLDRKAVKGCILNSRITWFFANAYRALGDEALLAYAEHGYAFMKEHCFDPKNGGIYWSVSYTGEPVDTTKHTYNQAFAIYALSSFSEAVKYHSAEESREALEKAMELYSLIETKTRDAGGYLEAFTEDFRPESNEKLSENGVLADRTMNTILHVVEAYTELLRVSGDPRVKKSLVEALEIIEKKIYDPAGKFLTVFMDHDYHTLLDLDSYGHDIEAAWLIDRAADVIGDALLTERMHRITAPLTEDVYEKAFDGHSIPVEIEKGKVKEDRVWWVQCEGITGFLEGYVRDGRKEYLAAAKSLWEYIRTYVIDQREGSEWYWYVNPDGTPSHQPIVEPWKCPYHNGRMCMEVIRRGIDAE